MVGRIVQRLKFEFRIISLIERQGDALTFFIEHLAAGDQFIENTAKSSRVARREVARD
jgi:hypothetical protein